MKKTTRVARFSAKRLISKVVVLLMLALTTVPLAIAEVVLYGGLGGRGVSSGPQASTNDGSLVIVSQTNGSTTLIGHPAGVVRISGLAFGLDGTLFGATQAPGGFPPPPFPSSASELIRINPDTGALVSSIPILDGATPLSIADLAVHPTTGILYGTGGADKANGSGRLYTIDTTSGAAKFIGDTSKFLASIAFAPDGTLYMASASVLNEEPAAPFLLTLDPANAAIRTQVPTADFYHSLAVRPTDGVLFGGTGSDQGVYTINPATGAATLIGTTGRDFVGDLAFRPVAGPPGPFDLNRQGLTGSWFQMATAGQGVELEIYPDLVAPGTGFLQGAWFTYDYKPASSAVIQAASGPVIQTAGASSQRWYTFSGNVHSGQASANLTIYQNTGGNFNALPTTNAVAVGTVVFSATDCTHTSMSYNFTDGSGRTGVVPMTRLLPNVTCIGSGPEIASADFGYSGNWFDMNTSGQGIVVELNPKQPLAWLTWYTYAPSGQGLGEAGQRWYTAQAAYTPGARSVPMTLYETTGGLFDKAVPTPATVPVGTVTATFTSCTAMQLAYAFTGGSSVGAQGMINMTRVGATPKGCGP